MKGIVFNLLEQVVVDAHGEDAWEDLLDDASLEGVYTSLGSYADEDLLSLVGAASEMLDLPADDIVRWFGRSSIPHFAERYPQLFEPHERTRSFVLTLNNIIHPEVRKLYPGATVPDFEFDASSPDGLVMGYDSPRKMCAFAEGLLHGAADHFGEVAEIEQPECMKRGDARCLLSIRFRRAA
jgi:hypothetical protein